MDGVCVVVVLAEAMMACVGRVANPSSDGKRRDHVAAVSSGECRIEAILMRGKFLGGIWNGMCDFVVEFWKLARNLVGSSGFGNLQSSDYAVSISGGQVLCDCIRMQI